MLQCSSNYINHGICLPLGICFLISKCILLIEISKLLPSWILTCRINAFLSNLLFSQGTYRPANYKNYEICFRDIAGYKINYRSIQWNYKLGEIIKIAIKAENLKFSNFSAKFFFSSSNKYRNSLSADMNVFIESHLFLLEFNQFRGIDLFLYPLEALKRSGFLIFSGGIEWDK